MASFHPAHKFAGVPAHHPLDHHVEDDRKAEAAEDAHKTADHAPGLEATLDQDIWARDHGHTYDAGAYQLGESLPATLYRFPDHLPIARFLITS
jgi:hypothetical protein